ncbi:Dna2/Cas4 domain of unknown function DUF83 [Penicillium paradoxum]|uniref:Dna2/Cas4 domain of unknown function DUF83 n=1 Tax=Penicillium paradoxum TaxID=176176 RepID=UPI002548551A|nr:Dna2/Cas4 domain of unknown function DUF83 [Penicillium paradoxum]KAJ5779458.1 Dna2/Cas4 domain of unknown function DUF83 [Penicillium paradoxum]
MATNAYPISSNSRTKLNAFRFKEDGSLPEGADSKDQTKPVHGGKEAQPLGFDSAVELMQAPISNGNTPPRQVQAPETHAQDTKPIKECPQTPGNRIPLADLISNAEDSFDPAPGPEVTPVEHVIWQHVPASSNPDTSSQTPAGRRRKRRHSSSPAGSPTKGDKKKGQKEALDLQSIQALLKTPQHDMAAELWNNYIDKNMVDGTEDFPPPRLANLLSSSPQTPASGRTSRDSSGLRRAISCTTEFPASRAKRRRVNRLDAGAGCGGIQRTSSNVESGKPRSRINYLMEKIERSINMAPVDAGPPGSSPLRQHMDARRCRSSSPTKDHKLQKVTEEAAQSPCVLPAEKTGQLPVLQESSSEFGDDDLDQDLMDLADASADPFIESKHASIEYTSLGSSSWGVLSADKSRSWEPQENSILNSKPPNPDNTKNNETKHDESDEFDDYDDLPDNLQEILAKCDTKPLPLDSSRQTTTGPGLQRSDSTRPSINGNTHSKTSAIAKVNVKTESSDDEFDDDFDLEAIEQTMNQAAGGEGPAYNLKGRQAIKRYQIVDITENTYVTSKGRTQPEQGLLVEDEKTRGRKTIILRESWFDTPCSKDSYIHLIGDFNAAGICVVDNSKNMIILHPDHLISATVVADSIDCQRRAVLQDRVKVIGPLERPQAFGVFFHEVFQEALKANEWDMDSLKTLVETVMGRHIEELYSIQMSIPEAVEYLMSRMPAVVDWADMFLHLKPQANSLVEDRNSSKLNLSINKLLEVEEHIWSPMYGLKGNIDATVQVTSREDDNEKNLVVPLELKTGRRDTNQSHRAQTALYTLLLSDRYDVDVTFGLLYYLELTKTLSIRGIRHELLQMIQVRNHLAGYIRGREQLPPMLKKARQCIRCYARTPCFIYHKLSEDGDGETSALGEDFDAAVGHLNNGDRDFFRKWDELLTKEEGNLVKFRRELWTLLSNEREALGRCFGDVVIDPRSVYEENTGTKINRYNYTFIKRQPPLGFSFAESQISVGDPIVVSDEKGHFALANGYVVHASSSHIKVGVDRKLHNARSKTVGFDAVTNQSFRGIMEVGKEELAALEDPEEQFVYRIDKDEFSNGMAIVRNNLICMMDKDLFQARQLRRLIVEGQPPAFKTTSSAYAITDPGSLNVDQTQAIDKVMSAKDYALVLGMPGTGKTTTIAHIIRALVAQGKSVLLTSYTHTAVDNILLKIRDDNIRVLRIGATAKIHPDVQDFADLAAIPKSTIEELKDSYEKPQVVATTCLGVNHNIFNQRIFDYCIVDEASQITLPVCLGPIRMARTFILVGDHYQLPPLVQNKAAQEGGLDVSLFKLLSDAQPDSVVNLEHQYRMCEEIMLLSNTLIYSGRLKCGTPQVAAQSLDIPNIGVLDKFHVEDIKRAPSQSQREICPGTPEYPLLVARLANTICKNTPGQHRPNRPCGSRDSAGKPYLESFIACGIPARNIGVITFYRSQLSLLRQSLRRYTPDLEMHTTDKFQGRDKAVVILSCVRSNTENNVGELLRDWRRVNVAFTRAQTKLLVVGSRSTLRDGNELLCKYVRLMESKHWVYNLPSGAVDNHVFHSCATQSQLMSPDAASTPGSAKGKGKGKKTSPVVKKSPSDRSSREPLSPLGSRQKNSGLRKPSKTGAKLFNGTKVVGNRPILRDIVNDLTG